HAGHGADADQANLFALDIFDELLIVERFCVPIDEQDLMLRRREGLEQEHPKVRHEVAGHAIVRVVKKNSHYAPRLSRKDLVLENPKSRRNEEIDESTKK